jgi:hypothetical protein
MNSSLVDIRDLSAGTIVEVQRGLYWHVGILSEPRPWGERTVISMSPGPVGSQVREEPFSVFAPSLVVRVRTVEAGLPGWGVLARARSGRHPSYSWTAFNCEHFVNFAHGLPQKSPQVAAWGALAMLVGLCVATGR